MKTNALAVILTSLISMAANAQTQEDMLRSFHIRIEKIYAESLKRESDLLASTQLKDCRSENRFTRFFTDACGKARTKCEMVVETGFEQGYRAMIKTTQNFVKRLEQRRSNPQENFSVPQDVMNRYADIVDKFLNTVGVKGIGWAGWKASFRDDSVFSTQYEVELCLRGLKAQNGDLNFYLQELKSVQRP